MHECPSPPQTPTPRQSTAVATVNQIDPINASKMSSVSPITVNAAAAALTNTANSTMVSAGIFLQRQKLTH